MIPLTEKDCTVIETNTDPLQNTYSAVVTMYVACIPSCFDGCWDKKNDSLQQRRTELYISHTATYSMCTCLTQ